MDHFPSGAITQQDLATKCDLSQKYLSELERGVKTASFETLVSLAHRGLNIRLAALFFGVDEDVPVKVRSIDQILAGRPEASRQRLLKAIEMLLNSEQI